jgi:hypothetical protein
VNSGFHVGLCKVVKILLDDSSIIVVLAFVADVRASDRLIIDGTEVHMVSVSSPSDVLDHCLNFLRFSNLDFMLDLGDVFVQVGNVNTADDAGVLDDVVHLVEDGEFDFARESLSVHEIMEERLDISVVSTPMRDTFTFDHISFSVETDVQSVGFSANSDGLDNASNGVLLDLNSYLVDLSTDMSDVSAADAMSV